MYALQQDETHSSVTICRTGTLDTNGHILTITGSGGLTCLSQSGQGGDLLIKGMNGKVVLSGGGAHLIGEGSTIELWSSSAVLQITGSSSTFNGRGEIIGKDPAAKISIASGKTLTSTLLIIGAMTIAGPGTLYNKHEVRATEDGTIVLASDLRLKDDEGSEWIADSAALEFHHTQTGNDKLLGNIAIANGTIWMHASITIGGGESIFVWLFGMLMLDADVVFSYEDFGSVSACNPNASGPPYSVQGPYCASCVFAQGLVECEQD
jgi:hypothetical protein